MMSYGVGTEVDSDVDLSETMVYSGLPNVCRTSYIWCGPYTAIEFTFPDQSLYLKILTKKCL